MCQKLHYPFAYVTSFESHNIMKTKHYFLHYINGKAKALVLNKLGCKDRTDNSEGRTSTLNQ